MSDEPEKVPDPQDPALKRVHSVMGQLDESTSKIKFALSVTSSFGAPFA